MRPSTLRSTVFSVGYMYASRLLSSCTLRFHSRRHSPPHLLLPSSFSRFSEAFPLHVHSQSPYQQSSSSPPIRRTIRYCYRRFIVPRTVTTSHINLRLNDLLGSILNLPINSTQARRPFVVQPDIITVASSFHPRLLHLTSTFDSTISSGPSLSSRSRTSQSLLLISDHGW